MAQKYVLQTAEGYIKVETDRYAANKRYLNTTDNLSEATPVSIISHRMARTLAEQRVSVTLIPVVVEKAIYKV